MIPVTETTLPAAIRAMEARPELAMFPLDNLARYGLGGEADRSMSLWADRAADPTTILGLTREGMVMPFAPGGIDAATCAPCLRGREIMGFIGAAPPVRAIMSATGLVGRAEGLGAEGLDKDEPQFLLDLERLTVPGGSGDLVSLAPYRDIAVDWRLAYDTELKVRLNDRDRAAADVARWIARDSHRVLVIDGMPVAMTGFNASLPDIVQVGGVYTPPERRNRGHARRAVALHLAEARAKGVRRATLFAASETAVACYRPLGFARIGDFAIVLLGESVTLPA
ncbi:MAG: GNAT family N-acetyltransferase [Pseudomonadota bacterium]